MTNVKKLPTRAEVQANDCWDLGSLYADDAAWEKDFEAFGERIAGYAQFRGKLGDSAQTLADCLEFDYAMDRLGDR